VFLSAGGYHHHIALNTWESLGGSAAGSGDDGAVSHGRDCLSTHGGAGKALRRVLEAGFPSLQGAADHGVSESIYLNDPDENGVELTATSRKKSGRARRMESWGCTRGGWICTRY